MRDDQVMVTRSASIAQHMIGELGQAVFIQARRDAVGVGNPSGYVEARARSWLLSEDGELYAWVLGVDLRLVREWVAAGCPWPKRGPVNNVQGVPATGAE